MFKSIFLNIKRFFAKKQKVMFVIPGEIPWTNDCRNRLNEFMRSGTGQALLSQLKNDLYFSQAQACVPQKAASASERCAIAHGKQLLIANFMNLYAVQEKEPEYALLSDSDINEILDARINGISKKEFVL